MNKPTNTESSPKVRPCSCAHSYQDLKYGKGYRLMNPTKAGGFRCTVCGKTYTKQ